MTTREFSDSFDALLSSYSQPSPFGEGAVDITLDEYEKSVFLTKAQKEIVEAFYSGQSNLQIAFEEKEQMREALDALVKTITPSQLSESSLPEKYKHLHDGKHVFSFYTIPSNLLYIVFEEIKFSSYLSGCVKGMSAVVVPTTHDEVWYKTQNPFRGPSKQRVLRVNADDNLIELISDYPIGSYLLRYVEEPKPIILTDLPDGLSIEGISEETGCKLPSFVHHKILDVAVNLAIQSKRLALRQPAGQ